MILTPFDEDTIGAGAYTAAGTETGANAGAEANGEWFGVDIDVEINVKWVYKKVVFNQF